MYRIRIMIYFVLIVTTNVFPTVKANVNSKSVNVELETSLQFDPKEGTNHSVKDIKTFIEHLQKLLLPIKAMLYPKKKKMSDVIENVFVEVNKYDDKEFGKLSRMVLKEVDSTISNNIYLSALLGNKYKEFIKHMHDNPTMIRTHTRKSANSRHLKAFKDLILKFDKYYDENDVNKLNSIIYKIGRNSRRNEDVRQLIRDALNVVVFDKYKKLNNTVKRKLFSELLSVQRYLKSKIIGDMTKTVTQNATVNNVSVEPESSSKEMDERKITEEAPLSIDNEGKQNATDDGEIIFNKDIEILIENDDLKSQK